MSQPLGIHYPASSSYSSRSLSPTPTTSTTSSSPAAESSSRFSNSLFFAFRLPFSPVSISSACSRGIGGAIPALTITALRQQKGSLQELADSPVSVELVPVCSDSQLDRVVAETQQIQDAVIVVWMANWCRKCIYLKPKLEKLAAEYYPRLRFYSVDVNTVSHKLVARAGVTKMPTIQLWKDGKKQAEVIGGHKAYWVINDVREMIEKECTM